MFVDEGVERFELPNGEWVDLKLEMSIGDWETFQNKGIQFEVGKDVARGTTEKDSDVTLLLINIQAWSSDQPVNRENVSKMRRGISNPIIERITEMNLSPLEIEEAKQKMKLMRQQMRSMPGR